jgi:hypothetical protein
MHPSITPPLRTTSRAVHGTAALAALLASISTVGSIDAMARHYALHAAAPESIVARAAAPARCGAPSTLPLAAQPS